jgi:hypothetical protein
VAIEQAMAKVAPILILDEAPSALDSDPEVLVQDALSRLMSGPTALVVAHRLATTARLDRIALIDDGAIVEQGSHHELSSLGENGVYGRLWRRRLQPRGRAGGLLASVTVADSRVPAGVTHSTFTRVPGDTRITSIASVRAEATVRVPNPVMVSPFTMPAFAAGDDATTPSTCAPDVVVRDGVVAILTPRKPPRPAAVNGETRGNGTPAPFWAAAGVLAPPHTL